MYAYFELNNYIITLSGNNVSFQDMDGKSITSTLVPYTLTTQVKAVPQSGYYFESISCTNNYIVSGFSSGTQYYSTQTLTIKNPTITTGGACTIKMHARNYPATATYHPKTCTGTTNCRTESGQSCTCDNYCWSSAGELVCCDMTCTPWSHTVCDDYTYDCSYYTYSCPNGGTLSGTTCVF